MKHFNLRQIGEVAVLTPHGYLSGDQETVELAKAFEELSANGNRRLVINLLETVHLNSTALGVFAAGAQRYKEVGGSVRLCHLNDRIRSAFVITHLGALFDDYATERKAIESFEASAEPER